MNMMVIGKCHRRGKAVCRQRKDLREVKKGIIVDMLHRSYSR